MSRVPRCQNGILVYSLVTMIRIRISNILFESSPRTPNPSLRHPRFKKSSQLGFTHHSALWFLSFDQHIKIATRCKS